jgi:hypothetical protein
MNRRLCLVLLASGILMTTWTSAQEPSTDKDEPPLRLKKKPPADDAPPDQPKPPKVGDTKPGDPTKEPEPAEPEGNDKEVLERISHNLRSLEERLANKELGDATRQVGEDILKDIDSLIRMSENPPQGGGGGEDSQNDQSNDKKNGGGKSGASGQSKPSGGGRRGQSKQSGGNQQQANRKPGNGSQQPMNGGQQPMGTTKPEQNQGTETAGGRTPGNSKTGGNDKNGELNPNADLFKDIWGHLPPALRAEMNAYATDKEMIPKYDALIKKCSRTIAEQSTRKDK